MQPRQKHWLRAAAGRGHGWSALHDTCCRARRWCHVACLVGTHPKHARLAQFGDGQRICRTRITPAHVPKIFGEHGAIIFARGGRVVERLVELLELRLHERWQIFVRRELDRPVIAALGTTVFSQHIHNQILRFVRRCVEHSEAHRQHEFFALKGKLQRPQRAVTEPCLFLQIHLCDEELHALIDVRFERRARAYGNLVAVVTQPRLQPV